MADSPVFLYCRSYLKPGSAPPVVEALPAIAVAGAADREPVLVQAMRGAVLSGEGGWMDG